MTTKQTTFLREIAFKFHPVYMQTSLSYQRQHLSIANKAPRTVSGESIVEESLAFQGGYDFVDEKQKDYNDIDESDSKTGTVNLKSKQVEIGSIGNKIGALRITIWNPILDTVDFMFIPYDLWKFIYANKCYGKNTESKLRLQMTWNAGKNHYNKFEIFRLSTFVELATMTEEKFYNLHPELKPQTASNISLLNLDSLVDPKSDPTQQTSIPCTVESDQQEIQDSADTQPISPCEIS